jgi:hypothetical protein
MGEGRTKKSAMQRAAEKALEVYGIQDQFEEQFVSEKPETRARSHNIIGLEQPFPLVPPSKAEEKIGGPVGSNLCTWDTL